MTETSLVRAHALVDAGRWTDARQLVSSVLATEPDSPTALCLLAQCELQLDDPAAARRASAAALALAPEDEWAYRLHAISLTRLGWHVRAVTAATEAVRLAPHLAAAHKALGHALLASPDRARLAYQVARRAIELDPHDADGFVLLGLAASKHKRRDEERAAYRKALELDPQNSAALNNLAALDLDRGRLGKAARQVTAALRADPQEAVLRANLDQVALRLLGRLLNAMLLTGFLLLIAIGAESGGDIPVWWPRALVGAALIASYATIAWLTLRHIPPGSRRYLRGLPRRLTGRARILAIALVVFSSAMLVAAFAPGNGAKVGAAIMLVMIRVFQVALIIMIIAWVARKLQ